MDFIRNSAISAYRAAYNIKARLSLKKQGFIFVYFVYYNCQFLVVCGVIFGN